MVSIAGFIKGVIGVFIFLKSKEVVYMSVGLDCFYLVLEYFKMVASV